MGGSEAFADIPAGLSPPATGRPQWMVVRDGLAVYRIGAGEPVLLMPGPHRFQRPGLPRADASIRGITGIGRSVLTFDPPGSGASTRPARLGMAEMHDCTREALDACGLAGPVDALGHSMGGLALLSYVLDHPARSGGSCWSAPAPAGVPTAPRPARSGGATTPGSGGWPRSAPCTRHCDGWPLSGC